MSETSPKFYVLSRQTLGHLNAAKRILDNLTRFSIAGSGISAVASTLVGGPIDLILPIIAAIVGLLTTTARDIISFVIDSSVMRNPLATKPSTTEP